MFRKSIKRLERLEVEKGRFLNSSTGFPINVCRHTFKVFFWPVFCFLVPKNLFQTKGEKGSERTTVLPRRRPHFYDVK